MSSVDRPRRVLIIVENLSVPFDRRVWMEATTLQEAGYQVNVICPLGKPDEPRFEVIDGVEIHRHPLPLEADGPIGYLYEYMAALYWEFRLAWRIRRTRGFDLIHACNPPDLIFLVGGFFKLFFGTKFVFDHHDLNPELYIAKFNKRDFFYRLMLLFERLTFATADVSIATNESYKKVAIQRGAMRPENVFVVRSGPKIERMKIMPPLERLRNGRKYVVGYLGVMGAQEGIDLLLDAIEYIVKKQKREDIQFLLVGGGTSLEAMKKYAVKLGINDYVTFTGRVSDQALLEALNTADICVNPDLANEMNDKSTMNKIIEYMALAKPIVQFDLTEGRVSAQDASLYARNNDTVDLAEKMLQLLADPQRRKTMGDYGRERVEKVLAWRYQVTTLLAAYDTAFGSRNHRPMPRKIRTETTEQAQAGND